MFTHTGFMKLSSQDQNIGFQGWHFGECVWGLGRSFSTLTIVTDVPHCSLWVMDWCSGAMLAERANWFLGPSAINDKQMLFPCRICFCQFVNPVISAGGFRLGWSWRRCLLRGLGSKTCSLQAQKLLQFHYVFTSRLMQLQSLQHIDPGCGCNLWPEMRYEALWRRVAQVCRKTSHFASRIKDFQRRMQLRQPCWCSRL